MTPAKPRITTAKSIDTLKPRAGRYAVPDSEVSGLDLRILPDGRKLWSLRYRVHGRQRRLKLGEYGPDRMGLADARTAARRELRKVDGGTDPQAEREAVRREAEAAERAAELAKRDSIEALCEAYIERHAKPTKRTWRDDQSKLSCEVLPAWKGRPVSSISRRDCRALVQAIADRGAPIYANRVAALLSRLFRFAVDDDLIEGNIAAKLPKPGVEVTSRPEAEREDKPYTSDEVRTIWQQTAVLEPAPRAMYRLGLVLGQRPGEISGMTWPEIDGAWWTIPAARAKNRQEHRVFLPMLARRLLAEVPRHEAQPIVFAGYRGKRQIAEINGRVFAGLRARLKPRHAMRDTVATGMAAAGVDTQDVSRVLNHRVGQRVTAGYNAYAYDREKRLALEAWSRRLDEILSNKSKRRGRVLPHRRPA